MSKKVTVGDLKEGQAYGLLLCPKCGGESSADKRDYWHVPATHVLKCCGVNSQLVRKVITYRGISYAS